VRRYLYINFGKTIIKVGVQLAGVQIKSLTKRFGDVVAVKNLDLEVKDKDLIVLLGPSGCGKTTTLRCVAGLETPDGGEIYIGDEMVNELPPKDRDVAMVFQSYALYPHMKVFDNIAFPLKLRKVPKSEIEERVKRSAELLRISHLLDRKPKQLSGGEAQRTALGRAIVREPKVFLMDEPLSNLDAKLRLYMRAELKSLQKKLGITTVYVTHDQAEAMTMADLVAVMNFGVLQQLSSPHELYDNPANAFVAGFIGSPPVNFIDCTFLEKDASGFLDAGTFTVSISDEIRELIKEKTTGPELTLGVRPEDLSVPKRRGEELFEAEVFVMEPLGSEVIVDLMVGDNLVKMRTTPDFRARPGQKVHVTFNKDKMHVFDKRTGNAII